MNRSVDSSAGIWQHILKHSPAPERDEIALTIGLRLIDENNDLLSELMALKDIIFESSGGRVSSANNWGKAKKLSGRRAISEARQYSQLHYIEDNIRESTILDVIYGMKKFTLEIINYRLEDIRESFEKEKEEFNQEIERLNNSLAGDFNVDDDTNTDIEESLPKSLSTMSIHHNNNSSNNYYHQNNSPVPLDRMEVCTICNMKRPVSSMMSTNTGSSKLGSSNGAAVCSICHTTRAMREAKISGTSGSQPHGTNIGRQVTAGSTSSVGLAHSRSLPAHLHLPSALQGDMKEDVASLPRRNNNEDSPDPAPKSARSSRFRNRLDSARHEHHFLEEF